MLTVANFLTLVVSAIAVAVISAIYILFLSFTDALNWWFRFGERHFRRWFFYKPVWECEACFAGQLSLWYYLIVAIRTHTYNVIEHIFFICLSILFTKLVATLLRVID